MSSFYPKDGHLDHFHNFDIISNPYTRIFAHVSILWKEKPKLKHVTAAGNSMMKVKEEEKLNKPILGKAV